MKYTSLVEMVGNLAQAQSFQKAFELIEESIQRFDIHTLGDLLLSCGIIPESFSHDSTEEKLWAKLCDVALSLALNNLGIRSNVIRTRGNSADVLGQTNEYTLVGDAKAFRLSRTAKNQKDFKISSLDDWRRDNTFAVLVAPLYQFPQKSSQIYVQAIQRNVTMLSYAHLRFLLHHSNGMSLIHLWSLKPNNNGQSKVYWDTIDQLILGITQKSNHILNAYKSDDKDYAIEVGRLGINYWQEQINIYNQLTHAKAVELLIQSQKIPQRIQTIEKTISWIEEIK